MSDVDVKRETGELWEKLGYNKKQIEELNRVPRGQNEVRRFCEAMIQTLNTPKNRSKQHWLEMTIEQLGWKLAEEMEEVVVEMDICKENGDLVALGNLARESVDLACVAMMIHEYAMDKLIKEAANG